MNLEPCPWCGKTPEVTKHFREDMWNLIHRCQFMGPIHIDWTSLENIGRKWNRRATDPALERLKEAALTYDNDHFKLDAVAHGLHVAAVAYAESRKAKS